MEKSTLSAVWGSYKSLIDDWVLKSDKQSFVKRLWEKDASLWVQDTKIHEEVKARLGWLNAPKDARSLVEEIKNFATEIKGADFKHVMLLGMGGSSLAPEVIQTVFGNAEGYPELIVLDSTDPGRISDIESRVDLAKTLFIVSSKSGNTIEPLSFYKYFYEKTKNADQFVAITDPGSPLETMAKQVTFRKIFLAPPDVGGRFSALTYFGLVPAALIGLDVEGILDQVDQMMQSCSADVSAKDNPAMILGIAMAVLSEEGKNKLTLLAPKKIESFGDWVEQLVAESSGKEGCGVVPVVREPLGEISNYGSDRLFVRWVLEGEEDESIASLVRSLQDKKHPLITLKLSKPNDLFGQFFLWELATAIACALLKVNAFDQPDVQAAKDKTKNLLKVIENKGSLETKPSTLSLEDFFGDLKPADYVGILAFLPDRPEVRAALEQIQVLIRNFAKSAVTLGIGPRYLHSTGQLHKGGPLSSVFILITAKPGEDLPVPGEKYTFGQLEVAQALGDYETLDNRERQIIRFELNDATVESISSLKEQIQKSISVWA